MNIEKKKGLELLGKGRQEEALKRLKKAVDITPEMIQNVTKVIITLYLCVNAYVCVAYLYISSSIAT